MTCLDFIMILSNVVLGHTPPPLNFVEIIWILFNMSTTLHELWCLMISSCFYLMIYLGISIICFDHVYFHMYSLLERASLVERMSLVSLFDFIRLLQMLYCAYPHFLRSYSFDWFLLVVLSEVTSHVMLSWYFIIFLLNDTEAYHYAGYTLLY